MVVLIIVMICIMLVDRVLYSTHAFLSRQTLSDSSPLEGNGQNAGGDGGRTDSISGGADLSLMKDANDTNSSMMHRESGQPYGRRQQALYSLEDDKREKRK